jgi:1-acyl-sn-glycerol-3-phosphate acyltransferase
VKYIVPTFYWSLLFVVKAVIFAFTTTEVVGREKMPRRGPLILASNHFNNADPPLLGAVMPRRLVFMAKQEMFQWPLIGMMARLAGAFPVRRSEADLGALRKAAAILRGGEVLAMFPEGTRSKDARLHEAHPGTALLALRSEAPILPVAISGTERVSILRLPFDCLRLRRPHIRVVLGDPFFLPPVERATAAEAKRCTDIIMGKIAALLPSEQRGGYTEAVSSQIDRPG